MQVRKFPKVILDIGLDISASVETNITSIALCVKTSASKSGKLYLRSQAML